VRKRAISAAVLLGTAAFLAFPRAAAENPLGPRRQETSTQDIQKPKYDYMSNFYSRSTQPLGLKEDPALKRLLNQGSVKWALRAGARQILN
jgi:hypothetical protein